MLEIYWKEIRELLRDRKTLILGILMPIFALPLLFVGVGTLVVVLTKSAATEDYRYALLGADQPPALAELFAQQEHMQRVDLKPGETIRDAVTQDRIKFALVVPSGVAQALDRHVQVKLELHFNDGSSTGAVVHSRVDAVINAYNDQLRAAALPSLRIDQQLLQFASHPIALETRTTANDRERMGAAVGGMLPYFMLIICLVAIMAPAIDIAAGEKERGTLETLLLAPVPMHQLVLAKFLVLFSFGMIAALLLLASLGVLIAIAGVAFDEQVAALASLIGFFDLVKLAIMLTPVAAMLSAVLLAISVYARSYKEAVGLMQPLTFLVLIPAMLASIPGVELNWWWAAVPITNVALAMKELVKGTLQLQFFAMILLSSALLAAGLLAVCQRWFSREEVLFRD